MLSLRAEKRSIGRDAVRENKLKTLWKNGGVAVNGWLGIPSSASAESMARCGWDSIVIDMQHGLVDYTDAVPMLQAISQTDAIPMVRVPWNMPDIIMKSLDAGAYGIVCPMINTPAECEEFIQNCRYAPRGRRSFGPIRAVMYGGSDYWKYANETILTIPMIAAQQRGPESIATEQAAVARPRRHLNLWWLWIPGSRARSRPGMTASPPATRHRRPKWCRGSNPTRARRGIPPRRRCPPARPSGR